MVRPHTSLPFHLLAPSDSSEPQLIVAIGFQTTRHRSNPSIACKDSTVWRTYPPLCRAVNTRINSS
jgi:hypothetical protein